MDSLFLTDTDEEGKNSKQNSKCTLLMPFSSLRPTTIQKVFYLLVGFWKKFAEDSNVTLFYIYEKKNLSQVHY